MATLPPITYWYIAYLIFLVLITKILDLFKVIQAKLAVLEIYCKSKMAANIYG